MKILWSWLVRALEEGPEKRVLDSPRASLDGACGEETRANGNCFQSFSCHALKKGAPEACAFLADPYDAAKMLTRAGHETHVLPAHLWAKNVVIATIVGLEKHPSAQSLQVCHVRYGPGEEDQSVIVCGAKNPRVGLCTLLAKPGAELPNHDSPITVSALRGITSHGMLCSPGELDLEDILATKDCHDIVDFSYALDSARACQWGPFIPRDMAEKILADKALGTTLFDIIRPDYVLDSEITPNRGDLLSHRGIARELLAMAQPCWMSSFCHCAPQSLADVPRASLKNNCTHDSEHEHQNTILPRPALTLALERPEKDVSFFSLQDIQVPSRASAPLVRRRLHALGIKRHNTCVDIGNYMAEGWGQPVHVFDAHALQGALTLRHSVSGESFDALNGQTYILPKGLLVLTDEQGIISLPGIMGAARGSCTEKTTHVRLEVAVLSPDIIAMAGQHLGIQSASRHRFERAVDKSMALGFRDVISDFLKTPQIIPPLGDPRLALMRSEGQSKDWGKNQEKSHEKDQERGKDEKKHLSTSQVFLWMSPDFSQKSPTITLAMSDVPKLMGASLDPAVAKKRLESLGAHVTCPEEEGGQSRLYITPPSWRCHWHSPQGCIEEMFRLNAYEDVPCIAPGKPEIFKQDHSTIINGEDWGPESLGHCLATHLVAQGLHQNVTWSMVSPEIAKAFQGYPDIGAKEGACPEDLALENPLSKEHSVLRPSVISSLLDVIRHHEKYRLNWGPFFEVGPEFFTKAPGGQRSAVAIVVPENMPHFFRISQEKWLGTRKAWEGFYALKSMVQNILSTTLAWPISFISAPGAWVPESNKSMLHAYWSSGGPAWLHTHQKAELWALCRRSEEPSTLLWPQKNDPDNQSMCWRLVGYIGRIDAHVLGGASKREGKELTFDGYVAQLYLEPLRQWLSWALDDNTENGVKSDTKSDMEAPLIHGRYASFAQIQRALRERKALQAYHVSALQPVAKDLSFLVPEDMAIGDLTALLKKAAGPFLCGLTMVDYFTPETTGCSDYASESTREQGAVKPPREIQREFLGMDARASAMQAHQRSVTLRFLFQPREESFTKEDLNALLRTIALCAQDRGAFLRGTLETL